MRRDRNGIGAGILVITVGVIFMAQRAGWGGFESWWPMILVVMGASNLLFPRDRTIRAGVVAGRRGCSRRDSRYSGLWLVMVGVIFLLHVHYIWRIHQTWPL